MAHLLFRRRPGLVRSALSVVIVGAMMICTTEDAYFAYVGGKITREEFFEVCSRNAELDRRPILEALERHQRASAISSAISQGADLR